MDVLLFINLGMLQEPKAMTNKTGLNDFYFNIRVKLSVIRCYTCVAKNVLLSSGYQSVLKRNTGNVVTLLGHL